MGGLAERLRKRGALWRSPDFSRLWAAQTISQFGSQITNLALPLAAILALHASAFQVAALSTIEFLPFVLLSLPAGVWVDRLRRRPILIAADVGRGLVLASIPIAYAANWLTIWQLYVVGFAAGAFTVFFDVAYQAYLPSVVEREHLSEGNSKLEVSRSAAQIGGPGLAGVLVGALSAPYAILVDAVSFLWSALFLFRIRREERPTETQATRMAMPAEIMEGLRYVIRHPIQGPLMVYVAASNFFTSLLFAIFLVYAVRTLGLGPSTIGLVLALGSVGSLVGALSASRLSRRVGIGQTIVGAAALSGWALLLIPLAPQSMPIPFLVPALLIFGAGAVVVNVTGISLMQAITPDRLLGRLTASRRFVVWGVIPIGSLLGGLLASTIGLRGALWAGAFGAAIAFVPALLSPTRSVTQTEDAEELVRAINDEFAFAHQEMP